MSSRPRMPALVTLLRERSSCFRARQLRKQLTSVTRLQLPRCSSSSVGISSRPRMPASAMLLPARSSCFRARQLCRRLKSGVCSQRRCSTSIRVVSTALFSPRSCNVKSSWSATYRHVSVSSRCPGTAARSERPPWGDRDKRPPQRAIAFFRKLSPAAAIEESHRVAHRVLPRRRYAAE
jgi:hypothetical protein